MGWLSRRRLVIITAVLVVFAASGVAAKSAVGASGDDLLAGPFPEAPFAPGQVVHMQTVENRAETNDVLSTDLWIERSTGKFLMIERKDSQLTSMSACDGSVFKAYEVAGHRAGEFTVDKMMSVEPDAITARRGVLESVKEYADALVERSDSPGSPIDVSGRSGLLFKAISRSIDGSRIAQADSLDLIVDKNTGLPLQETVRDPNGDTVSTKNYDYEVTSGPREDSRLLFPLTTTSSVTGISRRRLTRASLLKSWRKRQGTRCTG
jgi:hypothetical protein